MQLGKKKERRRQEFNTSKYGAVRLKKIPEIDVVVNICYTP